MSRGKGRAWAAGTLLRYWCWCWCHGAGAGAVGLGAAAGPPDMAPASLQVQDVMLEITDLLQWLEHVELRLFFSKPGWGHPDTTKETLAAHLVSSPRPPHAPGHQPASASCQVIGGADRLGAGPPGSSSTAPSPAGMLEPSSSSSSCPRLGAPLMPPGCCAFPLQELCKEMESKQQAYNGVRDRLQRLLASCAAARPCSTEHSLRILEQKWESVHAEVQERKVCAGVHSCAYCPVGIMFAYAL